MNRPQTNVLGNERGAILIQVAVSLVGLLAFGAMVVDYGVLWASRRQAQNAADAAALAGAGWLQTHSTDWDGARKAAKAIAAAHYVFGAPPRVNVGVSGRGSTADPLTGGPDISFPPCPEGAPGAGVATCVRVNIYRNEEDHDSLQADPLPTFFARLFGRTNQGVRATAYAEAGAGNTIDCLRPFTAPDLWIDSNGNGRYDAGETYRPPSDDDPTGYRLDGDCPMHQADPTFLCGYGSEVQLHGDPSDPTHAAAGWFSLLGVNGGSVPDINEAIRGCYGGPTYSVGQQLPDANGEKGGIWKGVHDLYQLDPTATWDPDTQKITNSCVDSNTCQKYVWNQATGQQELVDDPGATISPRVVPIPLYDPEAFLATGKLEITNFFGFFITRDMHGGGDKDIYGVIINEPELSISGAGNVTSDAAFITTLILVR